MSGFIYEIVTLNDRRFLIGSTQNAELRRRQHFNALRRGAHPNFRLQDSYDLHGEGNLWFGVLEMVEQGKSRLAREQVWLDAFFPTGVLLNIWRRVAPLHTVQFKKRPAEVQARIRAKCRRSKLGDANPAKRPEVRRAISEGMKKVWAERKQVQQ